MAWAISVHYIWVEAVHAKVLVPSGAREPWLNLAEWPVKTSLLQGRWQLWLNRNCSAQGKGCLEPVNAFFFSFSAVFAALQQRQVSCVGVWGAVVPAGLCWVMLLCSWLPWLWAFSCQLCGPEQIVPLRGWLSTIKNSVLSFGILLAEN